MMVRGIVLAGGTGTRMGVVSKAINKHCNLIYEWPMIMYPLMNLRACGINEVLIVTSEVSAGQFIQILGNGEELGMHLTYTFQKEPAGIADALRLGKRFAYGASIVAILGDNFFHPHPVDIVKSWDGIGAKIILYQTDTPEEFGVVATEGVYAKTNLGDICWGKDNKNLPPPELPRLGIQPRYPGWSIIDKYESFSELFTAHPITRIVEKPQEFIGNLMVTGMYMYDNNVWGSIDSLEPSPRGEYEISDVNNAYLERRALQYEVYDGKWLDCGNPDKLLEASNYVRDHGTYN